jgi:hypothetical protein
LQNDISTFSSYSEVNERVDPFGSLLSLDTYL